MLKVAKVLKPQGLKGEIKVEMLSRDSAFWQRVGNVYIDNIEYKIVARRYYKSFLYLKLDQINSIDQAEMIRQKFIFAKEEDVRSDDGDSYLISDLENCKLYDKQGSFVGEIVGVEKYGSADIINIKRHGVDYSFPYLKHIFLDVDIRSKKIVVDIKKLQEVII